MLCKLSIRVSILASLMNDVRLGEKPQHVAFREPLLLVTDAKAKSLAPETLKPHIDTVLHGFQSALTCNVFVPSKAPRGRCYREGDLRMRVYSWERAC